MYVCIYCRICATALYKLYIPLYCYACFRNAFSYEHSVIVNLRKMRHILNIYISCRYREMMSSAETLQLSFQIVSCLCTDEQEAILL